MIEQTDHRIIQGDCLTVLRTIESESVQCCVTSPPYFGLRNYGVDGQIGLEATPQEFVAKMVEVFEEVRRILRKDGVLFLNLGDSYWTDSPVRRSSIENFSETWDKSQTASNGGQRKSAAKCGSIKNKDLMLMPHRVAIALQDAGWWIRSDLPWVKRSAMPESATDRPAKALEYFFMLTKSPKYFFDMSIIRVKEAESQVGRVRDDQIGGNKGTQVHHSPGGRFRKERDRSLPSNRNGLGGSLDETPGGSRNFRNTDLWFSSIEQPHGLVGIGDDLVGLDVNPGGFSEAHFATFPPKLIEPFILAGSREGDIVLDPFAGAGTTLLVSKRLRRRSIGIELNPEYIKLIEHRLEYFHKVSPPKLNVESTVPPLFQT